MMKINSACEFGDSLDFDALIEKTDSFLLSQPRRSSELSSPTNGFLKPNLLSGKNIYHLHAILCHSGSLNQGHYFSFLKVGKPKVNQEQFSYDDGTWVKFND